MVTAYFLPSSGWKSKPSMIYPSETLVDFHRNTRRHIPEHRTIQSVSNSLQLLHRPKQTDVATTLRLDYRLWRQVSSWLFSVPSSDYWECTLQWVIIATIHILNSPFIITFSATQTAHITSFRFLVVNNNCISLYKYLRKSSKPEEMHKKGYWIFNIG